MKLAFLAFVLLVQAGPCPMDRLEPGWVCLKDALELAGKDLKKDACPKCGGAVHAVEFCLRVDAEGKASRLRLGYRCPACPARADAPAVFKHEPTCARQGQPPEKYCFRSGRPPHAAPAK